MSATELTTDEKRARAREMRRRDPQPSIREIADELGVSVNTAHGYVEPAFYRRQLKRNRENKRRQRAGEETTTK